MLEVAPTGTLVQAAWPPAGAQAVTAGLHAEVRRLVALQEARTAEQVKAKAALHAPQIGGAGGGTGRRESQATDPRHAQGARAGEGVMR